MTDASPDTPKATKKIVSGRVLMLYAGAGNKFVSRHLELHDADSNLRVLLDGSTEPQTVIDLKGCMLADYPENPVLGFSLCRSASDSDPQSPSRLGQFLFMCLNVEDKRKWMDALQWEIWRCSGEDDSFGGGGGTSSSNVKQSAWNKFRFKATNYIIDRGCRPPLHQAFLLKRTGTFMQDYVVRWCELRDRISVETTSLGGIVYASYVMAPPGEWSFVPMRIDTIVTKGEHKKRISVAGPNQDSVFFKFDDASMMEEWGSTLEMLVERAKIENDPQFAMELKLEYSKVNRDTHENREAKDELAETVATMHAQKEIANLVASGASGGDGDDDDADAASTSGEGSRTANLAFDSDDDDNEEPATGLADEDDDLSYEVRDLGAEHSTRVQYVKMLYAIDRNVHADRDRDSCIVGLQKIIDAPPDRFRPDVSPWKKVRAARHLIAAAARMAENHGGQAPENEAEEEAVHAAARLETFEDEKASTESVLVRFERRVSIAQELLGPSQVLGVLLTELDADSNDLRFVAQHIVDKFPRELKAAMIATRIDSALSDYQAIRESILVRQDMAKYREDFRITSSSASPVTSAHHPRSGGGGSGSATQQALAARGKLSSSSTGSSEAGLTVDEALKVINRVNIEGRPGGSEGTHKLRDALQFLTHFLSQFRDNFDVFDDAGFVIDEVGNAIQRGTKFLQEL